ncbi:hypothetical protein HPB47_025442 [Ixodes persulcatus]|uniref:Uncharacterized protein n=1 Tax=Ixodes persulcatus TaxID=34615 RepID=A0AC60Q1V8_IXOPE|nr:hypothetical protein HPB47_025442 [Ixodes persulcatus]
MTVEQQVLIALRFFATGGYQGAIATYESLAVVQSTVSRAVTAVANGIVNRLRRDGWVDFPRSEAGKAAAKEGFRRHHGKLTNIVGCVDGTFVAILGPKETDTVVPASYWCRKHHYAINVMVICDADMRIECIDPTMPGSTHDSFMWKSSWLREQLMQGRILGPGEALLGDSAYPLEPWMLTPVTNARACRQSRAIRRYNSRHASMRSVVERCIGLLKQRFRCLHKYRTLFYSPYIAGTIISACAILHNVCLYVGEPEPQPEPEDDSNQTPRPEPIANPPAPAQFGQLYERAQAARASQVARCERP